MYDPLRDFLAGYTAADQVTLSFGEIEELVGPLPHGAKRLRQWWSNDPDSHAQSWRAAGWRVLLVDMGSQRVLFGRYATKPTAPPPEPSAESAKSSFRGYLADLHLPLIIFLLILSVGIGSIGFAFRPGTDEPPTVSSPGVTLSVYQQSTAGYTDATQVDVDEVLMPENSSTVVLQVDVFATFATPGIAQWNLLTSASQSQPYSCPDPYTYLGTVYPDPLSIQNGQLAIGGQSATTTVIGDLTGRRMTQTASNVLGLYGQSPGAVRAGDLTPVAMMDLCWNSNLPLAFDGAFASASLPGVIGSSYGSQPNLPLDVSRSLYFENYKENPQPLTAEYSLQAGALPSTTDPYGWHWSASQDTSSVQVTALDISVSQHEAYLGFLSGVLFGVVGGAVVLIFQELLEPVRLRRRSAGTARLGTSGEVVK